jgi:hypothetical protein
MAAAAMSVPETREERRELYSIGAKVLVLSGSRRGTIIEVKPGGWYEVRMPVLLSGEESAVGGEVREEVKTLRPTRWAPRRPDRASIPASLFLHAAVSISIGNQGSLH